MNQFEKKVEEFQYEITKKLGSYCPIKKGVGHVCWLEEKCVYVDFFGDFSCEERVVVSTFLQKYYDAYIDDFSLRIGFHPDVKNIEVHTPC